MIRCSKWDSGSKLSSRNFRTWPEEDQREPGKCSPCWGLSEGTVALEEGVSYKAVGLFMLYLSNLCPASQSPQGCPCHLHIGSVVHSIPQTTTIAKLLVLGSQVPTAHPVTRPFSVGVHTCVPRPHVWWPSRWAVSSFTYSIFWSCLLELSLESVTFF